MEGYTFKKALPVWAEGKENEMNYTLLLRARLPAEKSAVLAIAGHTAYQIFVNGAFAAQGPARAGHGYFRADEIELAPFLTAEENLLCVLCAGYNTNSFEYTNQPSFVCAEVRAGSGVLCATGAGEGFAGAAFTARVQKVQRFSFQRPFTESYVFGAEYDRAFTDPAAFPAAVSLVPVGPKRFLVRETPRSDYERRAARRVTGAGTVRRCETDRSYGDRSFVETGDLLKGFRPEELEVAVVNELYGYKHTLSGGVPEAPEDVRLPADGFAVYDMGLVTTGYICLEITPAADTAVFAVFNEILPPGGVPAPDHGGMASAVRWALAGGRTYRLVSFAAYTYRYIEILSAGAPAKVSRVWQVCEHYPAAGLLPPPPLPDGELEEIWNAAAETFRQNAVDIFMDCPSRERAGWLCDSFFTARAERALTGKSLVEKAFLENFLMEETFRDIPAGMLPMCYPSDHPHGTYIPNWAMWYGLQLGEYAIRTGDTALVQRARPKMEALAAFFTRYENEAGLLEGLESWVFVEWSRANDFTQDVNFPTNMLYARFLETLGALYGCAAFSEKAERIKNAVRKTAFDGAYFQDNAVRRGGALVLAGNHTETAQYYAFFTGTATPESHPALWQRMKTAFGPGRDPETEFPDVPVSNAFIGNYLRLETLFRQGEYALVEKEIRAFFLPMARATGTLWENMHAHASCCHGFASAVAWWMRETAARRG